MLVRLTDVAGENLYVNCAQVASIRPGPLENQAILAMADGRAVTVGYDMHEVAQVVEAHLSDYVHPEKRLNPWHLE